MLQLMELGERILARERRSTFPFFAGRSKSNRAITSRLNASSFCRLSFSFYPTPSPPQKKKRYIGLLSLVVFQAQQFQGVKSVPAMQVRDQIESRDKRAREKEAMASASVFSVSACSWSNALTFCPASTNQPSFFFFNQPRKKKTLRRPTPPPCSPPRRSSPRRSCAAAADAAARSLPAAAAAAEARLLRRRWGRRRRRRRRPRRDEEQQEEAERERPDRAQPLEPSEPPSPPPAAGAAAATTRRSGC